MDIMATVNVQQTQAKPGTSKSKQPSSNGIQKRKPTRTACRKRRYSQDTWDRWEPKIMEWYKVYALKKTVDLVQNCGAKEGFVPNERQLRHFVENKGVLKYTTAKNKAKKSQRLKRGTGNGPEIKSLPNNVLKELGHFWLALLAEKKAFPILSYFYAGRSTRRPPHLSAVISMARTASKLGESKVARLRLMQAAMGGKQGAQPWTNPQDLKNSSSNTAFLCNAFYALVVRRCAKALEEEHPDQWAASALEHLFSQKEPLDDSPEQNLNSLRKEPLGREFDFLTYLGLIYTSEACGDQPVLRGYKLEEAQRENIHGKFLDLQPAIVEIDSVGAPQTGVVRNCLAWIAKSFTSGFIRIPDTLREIRWEHEWELYEMWRDELELYVGLWSYYLDTCLGAPAVEEGDNEGGRDDNNGWSRDCERDLAIYPAELMLIILRCAMTMTMEVSNSQRQKQEEAQQHLVPVTPPNDGGLSVLPASQRSRSCSRLSTPGLGEIGGLGPSKLSPISFGRAGTWVQNEDGGEGRTNHHPHSAEMCSPEATKRRERLVSRMGRRFDELRHQDEKQLWSYILSWFVEMNRLDGLTGNDPAFKELMIEEINSWVENDLVSRFCSMACGDDSISSGTPLADINSFGLSPAGSSSSFNLGILRNHPSHYSDDMNQCIASPGVSSVAVEIQGGDMNIGPAQHPESKDRKSVV